MFYSIHICTIVQMCYDAYPKIKLNNRRYQVLTSKRLTDSG